MRGNERADVAANSVGYGEKLSEVCGSLSFGLESNTTRAPLQSNSEITIDALLAKLRGKRKSGNQWTAKCPAHDDQHNSLSVGLGDNGTPLLYCHAGCSYEQIVAALGFTMNGSGPSRVVKTYDYRDEGNTLLFQVLRYVPKGFSVRHPDGNSGYKSNIKGVRRVLYRLPEILAAQSDQTVLIVEGEKDADRLATLGFVATTNFGGAGKWHDEYSEALRGRPVALLPDNDDAGRDHIEKVARSLVGCAVNVKVVQLPNLPPKGDVSDYLAAGNTAEALRTFIDETPFLDSRLAAKVNQENRESRSSHFTLTPLADLLNEPEEEVSYVWDKTLPRGGFSICAAKPKVGKSTLTRNLIVAVSSGSDFFGRSTLKGKVIYLCLEEKRGEISAHFRRMGANSYDILIHTGCAPDNALVALDELEAMIQEEQPVLVVIDPISRFVHVADFNNYAEVTRALAPLIDLTRRTGCHILVVHHNSKGEREAGDALLGSTAFFGAVDTLITMKRREHGRTLLTVQRYGEDLPETVVIFDLETGEVRAGGDMATIQVDKRVTEILDAIGDETLTEPDIRERVGGNQTLTVKAIRALTESGSLIRSGGGKRGDPYRYAKPTTNEDESSILNSSNLENPENRENLVIAAIKDEKSEAEAIRELYNQTEETTDEII